MSRSKEPQSIDMVIAARRRKLQTRAEFWSLLLRLATVAIVGYLLLTYAFLLMQMSGQEMFPAIKDGDLLIAFRLQQNYAKEDIVVYAVDDGVHVGRIVARATDNVNITEGGQLIVNGTVQGGEILYPTYPRGVLDYPCRVPEDCVFLLGDNRTVSTDSRDFGAIPLTSIKGKVITLLRRRGL